MRISAASVSLDKSPFSLRIPFWGPARVDPVDVGTSGKMKGDVGMSVHEKEGKQEDAYTKTQTHS